VMIRSTLVAAAAMIASGSAFAATVPFTETFSSSDANWSSASVFAPLSYPASGGPDGSGYGSTSITFPATAVGTQPLLFRGQSNFNSSGNAFVGNWITEGITAFSFSVRHNASAPVDFFARFSAAGPGAVALAMPAAQPNVWTTYTVPINPAAFFIYEGTTFASTFSNISRVQVGLTVDAGITDTTAPIIFDIDNVSIVPAPGAASLLGLGALVGLRRRRR
jgi:uncharacterized protein (TIGR03382 family)